MRYPKKLDDFDAPFIKHKIAKHIMTALMIGFAVPAFLTSPFGLYFLVRGSISYAFRKSDFNREVKRLQKKGYVALTKTPKGWMIRLLEKGKKKWDKIKIDELKLPKKKSWDKKWRLYIFDIPEDERLHRDLLREKLKDLGMYNFQRSTFVYPYDCRDELSLIGDYFKVDRYTTYAVVESIDIDRQLRKYFKDIL